MLPEVLTAYRPRCAVSCLQINHDKLKTLYSECDPPNLVEPSLAQSRGVSVVASRIPADYKLQFSAASSALRVLEQVALPRRGSSSGCSFC